MIPTLVLIRGMPGNGKTTKAQEMTGYMHFENDMWQDYEKGFSEEQRKEAVRTCLSMTREALLAGIDVVVSNCFLRHASMMPYKQIAKETGATLEIVTLTNEYGSVHNIPEHVLISMKEAFEP